MRQRRVSAFEMQSFTAFLVRGTRRAALSVVGFALIAVGLAGLVLPVLPGWVLVIGGFAVLSREYAWAHSGLGFARRQAGRGGAKLRSLAPSRRRTAAGRRPPSDPVVIDLTRVKAAVDTETYEPPRRASGLR